MPAPTRTSGFRTDSLILKLPQEFERLIVISGGVQLIVEFLFLGFDAMDALKLVKQLSQAQGAFGDLPADFLLFHHAIHQFRVGDAKAQHVYRTRFARGM